MSTNNPRGFVEHRNLSGRVAPITRMRRVKADGVSGSHQKFPGDPVVLVSGNTVARIPAAGTAQSLPILGIIRAVLDTNKRPLTFNQPSVGGPFLPASTAGWVQVNEDPHQTYIANCDSSLLSTHIGQYFDVTAGSANTAAGRSGMSIEIATGINTAKNTAAFQVVEIAPNNLDGFVSTDNNQDAEIIINHQTWRLPVLTSGAVESKVR